MNTTRNAVLVLFLLLFPLADYAAAQATPKQLRAGAQKQKATVPSKQPRSSQKAAEALGDYVAFPSVGVKIRQPSGFEKAPNFEGFGQEATQSSIMAINMPAPYAQASAGFTAEKMTGRGMKLLGKEDIKVGELPGLLVHFEQTALGTTYEKWSVAFGNEKTTTLVTATFPKKNSAELSMPLKLAVLSALPDNSSPADPTANVPFSIVPAGKLQQPKGGMTRTLAFSLNGDFPIKSPTDPFLVAAQSIGNFPTANRRATAEQRLRQLAQVKNPIIRSTNPIQIDGLGGYESIADAQDDKTATPIVVYQVMLFDETSYILIAAMVGKDGAGEFLPAFQKMASSLKRKQP